MAQMYVFERNENIMVALSHSKYIIGLSMCDYYWWDRNPTTVMQISNSYILFAVCL